MGNGEELFGPERTWLSVQNYCIKRLRTVYPWLDRYRHEDAAAEAVLWGMTVWVKAPSSVVMDNPDLTFKGARWACSRKAAELLTRTIQATVETGHLEPPARDPLLDRASNAIDELEHDDREWVSWARDFLDGKSTRQTASEEGVSHITISRRRREGIERIRPLLKRHGL